MRFATALLLAVAIGGLLSAGCDPTPLPRGDPDLVQHVIVYGDSLWKLGNGCDGCGPLLAEGWTVLNAAVSGSVSWADAACKPPYPNNLCTSVSDQLVERPTGECGRVVSLTPGAIPRPTCLRQLYEPGDVVVVQIGTNDVRMAANWETRLEGFIKPAWWAILDETEAVGAPVVVVYTIPIFSDHVEGMPGVPGLEHAVYNERLREIRSWLAGEVEGRPNVVEVDAYQEFFKVEALRGTDALLGLYASCPRKGTASLLFDCTHLSVPPVEMNGGDVLGEAVKTGVLQAILLAE